MKEPSTDAPDAVNIGNGVDPGTLAPVSPAPTGADDGASSVATAGAEAAPPVVSTAGPSDTDPIALRPAVAAALVFLSGGAVLVLEILSLRLIAPYVGLTLEMNTAVIGVALTAIAVGAWLGGRLADTFSPHTLLGLLFGIGGALTLAAGPAVRWAGEIFHGDDNSSALSVASIAIFAPAAVLSAISPVVVKAQLASLRRAGSIVGRLSSFGTLGSITATFGTGFILVALLPTTVILAGLGVVLIGIGVVLSVRRLRRMALVAVLLVATGGVAATALAPNPCATESRYHCIAVQTDPDNPNGRILRLNSAEHSYVDLTNPSHLEYSYARAMADAINVSLPAGPLRTVHIGAGGLTLPRYLANERPGSTNIVYEVDGGLVEFNRTHLGFNEKTAPGVSVRVRDGRIGTAAQATDSMDLVIGDAAGEDTVPWHLATREFATDVRRVMTPTGLYALNLIDGEGQQLIKAEAATLAAVFEQVAVIAVGKEREGTFSGNFVLLASDIQLDIPALKAALDSDATLITEPSQMAAYTSGAPVLTDDFAPVDQLSEG